MSRIEITMDHETKRLKVAEEGSGEDIVFMLAAGAQSLAVTAGLEEQKDKMTSIQREMTTVDTATIKRAAEKLKE